LGYVPREISGRQEGRKAGSSLAALQKGAITMALELKELTEKIIGAAIAVHRELCPGFIESVYECALVVELEFGLKVSRQHRVPVIYRGVKVGRHRLDLFVESTIIVELKAIEEFRDRHFAVVRSYLKAANRQHGLLMNFAHPTLQLKRVIAK
jgi:GxxExxY protein